MAQKLAIDKRILFEDLTYKPHAGQQEVHDSNALRRVVCAGSRWGKSSCASMEAIAAAMAPSNYSLGWIVTPSAALTGLLFQQILAIIELRLAHRIVRIEPRERLIVLRNLVGGTSEIRGRSAEHPSSLLGAGLDWLIIDDAAVLEEDVWSCYLSARLIDRGGWALLLGTPRGWGWYAELFRCAQEGWDPDFESWRFPSWTSPLLDPPAIERERGRLTPEVFAQQYGAEFVGPDGVACTACGWPEVQAEVVSVIFGDEETLECAECGRLVDQEGRPIGRPEEVRTVDFRGAPTEPTPGNTEASTA